MASADRRSPPYRPTGITLTVVGSVLLDEARSLLDHADRVRVRVSAAAGAATLTVGILGDGTDPGTARLAAAYRRRRPGVDIRVRDTDLTDPTCGLRAGLVDVALTRAPFDETALTVRALRTDPVGVVLRADDPLARRDRLRLAELEDRRWFQFPPGTDPLWQSYWNGGRPREGPVVRAVQECLQAVLWNGTVGLAPARPRPARRAGRGAADRHAAEPRGGGVQRGRHQPADPVLPRDRDQRVPSLSTGVRRTEAGPPARPVPRPGMITPMSSELFLAAGDTPPPVRGLVLVAVFGVAGLLYGGALAFNVRGTADAFSRRRQALLEHKARTPTGLAATEHYVWSPRVFRVIGCIVLLAAVFLLLLDALFAL